MRGAIMRAIGAFVDVAAVDAVTFVAGVAFAGVIAGGVDAGGMLVAVVDFECAFVSFGPVAAG